MAKVKSSKKGLAAGQADELFKTLKQRFDKNMARHKGLEWNKVLARLEAADASTLHALDQMEATGGEPDVVGFDKSTGEYIFYDCSPETPKDRRSLCYDREGLESRKENRPANSAIDMAAEMGISMLDEEEYRRLQALGKFDQKTSSWLRTPDEVREHGGAIFGDYRYGRVFVYHNGAQSYYNSRAFRGSLKI